MENYVKFHNRKNLTKVCEATLLNLWLIIQDIPFEFNGRFQIFNQIKVLCQFQSFEMFEFYALNFNFVTIQAHASNFHQKFIYLAFIGGLKNNLNIYYFDEVISI